MPRLLLICLAGVLFLSGCASRGEVKRFQQQMDYLTQANAEQQKYLQRLDSLVTAQQEALRQIRADQQYNMDQLQAEMRIIEQIFIESGNQVHALSERIQSIRKEMTTPAQPQDSSDTAASAEPLLTVDPKQLYETASLDFNKGKFELAKMEFEQFVAIFPNSALTDDAEYYIAECLDELGKYRVAKRQYLMVREKYPESNLVSAALYKAALISLKLDDVEGARKLLNEVIRDYPQSPEAPLAEEKLMRIGE